MGLFTRNTMDAEDLSRVAGYCALRMLLRHHQDGVWVDDDRYRYVHDWLKKAKHRAPTMLIGHLVRIADTVARRYQEERPDEVAHWIETEDTVISEHLMRDCREELDEEGITSK